MEPSIRSSYKPSQGVLYTKTKPAAHEHLMKLVRGCLQDTRIHQPLEGEKAMGPLSKGMFYLLVHPRPVETGFLIFSPRHAPVFLNETMRYSYIIRMRLSATLHNLTAIFAASLDKSDGELWIEDCLFWDKDDLKSQQSFTKRREIIKQFLSHHWMPDDRCAGGLSIRIANYRPLEDYEKLHKSTDWTIIDFCPELQGRRRFRLKAAGGIDSSLVAQIKPVTGLPDVYELWSSEEICAGRAAIQEMSLSRQIRQEVLDKNVYVEVEWNPNFQKFRVTKIVPTTTPRSPIARFNSSKHQGTTTPSLFPSHSHSSPTQPKKSAPTEFLIVDEESE